MQNESIKLFVSRDRKCTIPTQKLASTVSPDLMTKNKWTHFDFLRVPKDYSGIFFKISSLCSQALHGVAHGCFDRMEPYR